MMQKFQREYQRAQCIALGKAGMTYRKISTIVNMSKSSVQRAVKHFEEKSDFYDRRGSDRPKKLNDRNVRMFKHLVQTGHRYSAREIMLKLKTSIKIPKLFLNKNDKKDRLDWCLEYSNWTINEWKDVTFSDELIFFVIKRKNETKIWRTKDERWKEGCMQVAAMGGISCIKKTQRKLHELGVNVFKWLGKRPDLNPIEQLWSIVDDKL
ncbi:unnamed protein product [Rotaria sp. Silwood1]|nr:unnamed protein product [Rotaria sp. Silwood1]